MSYIYADTSDGVITKSASSYTSARHATSGSVVGLTGQSNRGVWEAKSTSGRASLTRTFTRSYFWFDTSGVTDCSAVSLELVGFSSTIDSGESIVVMKSDAFGGDGTAALASTDFDNIIGWDGSSDMSGATKYSAAPTLNLASGWSTSSYNSIPLGTGAENDINNNNYIIICCVSYKYDYLKADPVDTSGLTTAALANNLGCYHSPSSGDGRRPRLSITHAPNYGKVNSTTLANIKLINTTSKSNIEKIITVD
jgi:hypothetical protein